MIKNPKQINKQTKNKHTRSQQKTNPQNYSSYFGSEKGNFSHLKVIAAFNHTNFTKYEM